MQTGLWGCDLVDLIFHDGQWLCHELREQADATLYANIDYDGTF